MIPDLIMIFRIDRKDAGAAIADAFGRDTLMDGTLGQSVDQKRRIGMTVDFDKTGAQYPTGRHQDIKVVRKTGGFFCCCPEKTVFFLMFLPQK